MIWSKAVASSKAGKRQDLLKMTLDGFGVKQNGKALQVHASTENFPPRKHNLVQAILAVNDMFYLAAPMAASLFYEDVSAWLDANDIRYTPEVKFTGKTGYDHRFDFVIPKSRQQPERHRPDHQPTEPRHGANCGILLDRHEGSTFARVPRVRTGERL